VSAEERSAGSLIAPRCRWPHGDRNGVWRGAGGFLQQLDRLGDRLASLLLVADLVVGPAEVVQQD
jgi:hypothetical protein